MPHHLEQRRLGWYAVLSVPTDVQNEIGKKRFRVSLKTRDKKIAERKAGPIVSDWQRQIALAQGDATAKDDPAYWRDVLRQSEPSEFIHPELEQHLYDEELVDYVGPRDRVTPEAQEFLNAVYDTPTKEHIEEWIGSLQVKAKTVAMRRSTIERLVKKFPTLDKITRREVRRWVTDLLTELKPATVQRMMTDCRTYWAYLETIKAVPEDSAPFDKLGLKVRRSARQPWEPEDLLKLHRTAEEKDQTLADLIRLAMYTGARLSELVGLKVADVAEDHFRITDAKTEAGKRTVPIHRELKQTVARLVEAKGADQFVLSGISGQHRADTMSKAFARHRKALGYTGSAQVFHSIRNTVITMLERAGAPESTVQDFWLAMNARRSPDRLTAARARSK